jgi:hypothetical protein
LKIAVFYHVGQIGAWAPIYQSQVHRLYASGLIQESSYIYFGVNGNEQLFSLPENVIVQRNKNIKEETDTLVSLKNFASKNPDYKILYFHTKGVSRNTLQTNAWRLFMEYFVIDKWKQCVEYLNEYDCCGTDYRLAGKTVLSKRRSGWAPKSKSQISDDLIKYPDKHITFFVGNFWWANASYINQLDEKYLSSYYRMDRELWIGSNKNCKAKCLFYSYMDGREGNFYKDIYDEKQYIN